MIAKVEETWIKMNFNTFTMQFVLYVVYVFLFQFLISSLRSTSEFYMTKTLFVSRGAT